MLKSWSASSDAVTNSMTFGRRAGFGTAPRAIAAESGNKGQRGRERTGTSTISPPAGAPDAALDDELRAWKRERRAHGVSRIPWQPLLLVASLSFFLASFVLPASVNSAVDSLLDLLAVASALAWLGGRRKRSADMPQILTRSGGEP
jgi:hypothetical protein